MNKLYLILLFTLTSILTYSQNGELIGKWTNGFYFFWSNNYNDSIVLFEGGNLHEGGSAFSIVVKSDKSMFIYGRHPEFMEYPSIGEVGNKVDISNIQGKKYIIVKNSKGKIVDFLVSMNNQTLEVIKISNKIKHELAGTYVDKTTGDKISFLPNKKNVIGLIENQNNYSFEYEYDVPINVITIKGKSFYYELTENGLDIFIAKKDKYNDWTKLEKIKTLEKVEWYNLTSDDKLKGKYQFASTQLLIDDILSNYTPYQLRLIRNEIFARHGYIFKTDEMSEYFKTQSWYKPAGGNINEKITKIERLNILLIKRYEEKKNEQ